MKRDNFVFPGGFFGWRWLQQRWPLKQAAPLRKYRVAPRLGTCMVRRRLLLRWLPAYAARVSTHSAGDREPETL